MTEKKYGTLTMRTWHISDVIMGLETKIEKGVLTMDENGPSALKCMDLQYVKALTVEILKPDQRHNYVNTIMDIFPVAVKASGHIGTGSTHILTGLCVMLTGCDENGVQAAEFGSSEGMLDEHIIFGRPGTPGTDDIIIHVDVRLSAGACTVRQAITEAHKACDAVVEQLRSCLKKLRPKSCDEKHIFTDKICEGRKNVVIIKQVAGQGAMYDTSLLPKEPCGVQGGLSVIDGRCLPVILSPNEYRDGAVRSMS